MYNYFQKFFLIFLLLCISFVYGMEDNLGESLSQYKLNSAFSSAVTQYNEFTQKQDLEKIKEYIEQGADPDYICKKGMTLAGLAVKYLDSDLLKYLIQHNIDINKRDDHGYSPLKYAVCKKTIYNQSCLEIIKELCDAGASLIVNEYLTMNKISIFHYLTLNKMPKKDIEVIITHARFDTYDKVIDKELKKRVKTALLVFNRLASNDPKFSLPPEVKFRILSHLALDYFDGFNKKFCKKLDAMNFKNIFFIYLEKRVKNINKILQLSDISKMTPLQWWDQLHVTRKNDDQYDAQIKLLFSGTVLCDDMRDFKHSFPTNITKIPKDNLVLKMYNNALELLHK